MSKKVKYTREELITICEDAVVPFQKWGDRDSYSAQRTIDSIYGGLKAGVNYEISTSDSNMIWIYFEKPTHEQLLSMPNLDIDSRDSYIEWYESENDGESTEMFDGDGIDWYHKSFRGGYLPTPNRLEEVNGGDWY